MKDEKLGPWGWVLLAALSLFQLWLLAPEFNLHPTPLNDDALHIAASLKARDVLSFDPGAALDPWFSYWSLGYPLWHSYQPLPHLITGALSLLVPADGFVGLYALIKLILLIIFPFCVLIGARGMGLDGATAVAAALVSPLLATDSLYGLDYGSFLWRGSGLYTQLWAMDLLPLAVGLGVAALRKRAGSVAAALLVALTFLCHAIYGYLAGISLVVAAVVIRRERGGVVPLGRLAAVLTAAGVVAAFFVVPMLLDGASINHSRWEAPWKWDSFGHEWVLSQFFKGELFDHGRLPVVSILVVAGLALSLRPRAPVTHRFVAAAFATWLALYFGRPTWGVLLRLAGIPADFHLHRLIGGVHLFGILLAGIALVAAAGWIRSKLPSPIRALAGGAAVALLLPAAIERRQFTRDGDLWAVESERSIESERKDIDAVVRKLRELQSGAPGRIYPGLAAGWGKEFRTGSVPMYAQLSLARLDTLAFLYHAMSLPSDVMVLFEENRPLDYDIFDVRYALMDRSRAPLPFLKPAALIGRFTIYDAPSTGRIGAGSIDFVAIGGRNDVYGFSSAWLRSDLPPLRRYGVILAKEDGGAAIPILHPGDPLPPAALPVTVARDTVSRIRRSGDEWAADVDMAEAGIVFLKESFHPGWRLEIDGSPVPPVMVTPGFVGGEISAGHHSVIFRFRPGPLKWALFLGGTLGFPLFVAGWRLARRGRNAPPASVQEPSPGGKPVARTAVRALLLLIVLAGALPLLQAKLPAGHDALEYSPRLVEFHESIIHGRLLPAWAPDLGNGYGQPLFIFSPPLFYAAAELFHLLGVGLALSMGLSSLLFYLAAGCGAYLAGKEAWGRGGGILTAAAFTLSPYLLLDLYVRGNFAEFAAVALFPWAAWALLRSRRTLVPLAVVVALVALTHVGALLILVSWVVVFAAALSWARREAKILLKAVASTAIGCGLAAFFLIPCVVHLQDVKADLLRADFLSYEQHFVEPAQLLQEGWGYGLSVPGPGDGMSFSVGLVHLGLAVVAVLLFGAPKRAAAALPAILLGTAAIFALLTTPLASGVWRIAPPLQYLAYPWRFLSVVSLSLSLASGALAAAPPLRKAGLARGTIVAALLVLFLWGYAKARPSDLLTVDDAYYAPLRIASLGMNTTTREEYEPRWVRARPPHSSDEVEIADGTAFVLSRAGDRWGRLYRMVVDREATVILNIFYFPGWVVRVDGVETDVRPREEDGRMVVRLPAGRHDLAVEFHDTGARIAGKAMSIFTLLAIGISAARNRRRRWDQPA